VSLGSPLRKRLLYWQIRRVYDAMARSDVELVQLFYEPDAEVWMNGMGGVGIQDRYRGREGVRELYADVDEAWAHWSWSITSIADGGDRVAIRGDFVGYGRRSGVKTDVKDGGTALQLSSRGLVARQEWYVEQDGWKKAFEAVGLAG
jgi:hypothetical protein